MEYARKEVPPEKEEEEDTFTVLLLLLLLLLLVALKPVTSKRLGMLSSEAGTVPATSYAP